MKYAVGWTRFIVAIGAISSFIMGTLLFVAAALEVGAMVINISDLGLGSREATKELVVAAVEHADKVLIAAALIIIGIGLYALFIEQVARLPRWLEVDSLEDLKNKLVNVVVAVLAVSFFTRVIEWDGSSNIIYLGAAIGLVVVSLAAYGSLHLSKRNSTKTKNDP